MPTTKKSLTPRKRAKKAIPQSPHLPIPKSPVEGVRMISSIAEMRELLRDRIEILVNRGRAKIAVAPLSSADYASARLHLSLKAPLDSKGQEDYEDAEFLELLRQGDRLECVTLLSAGLPDILIPGTSPSAQSEWLAKNWTDRDIEQLRKAIRDVSKTPLPSAAKKDDSEDDSKTEPELITDASALCQSTSETYIAVARLPAGEKVGWKIKPLPQELAQLADALNTVSVPRRGKNGALNMNDFNYRRSRSQRALAFQAYLAWYGLADFDWGGIPEPKLAPKMQPDDAFRAISQISAALHQCVPRVVDFAVGEISATSQADLSVYDTALFY